MKPVRRRHPHPEIPLVSTADVTFLLLIFFLSTAIFSTERGILLGLPRPGEPARVVRPDQLVRIQVLADRSILVDGSPWPAAGLRAALTDRLRRTPDLLVSISVDPRAPYASLVETLDQVKLSGARQISLGSGGGA
jgi:biopolymer transport protein ExbD